MSVLGTAQTTERVRRVAIGRICAVHAMRTNDAACQRK